MAALRDTLDRFERARFTVGADVEPRECSLCVSPRELLADGRPTGRLDRAPVLDERRRDASRTA